MTTTESLLAVFAHPDDESLASGGLLALAVEQGARVTVLSLTRGELRGRSGDGGQDAGGEIRARELEAAGRVLGVHESRTLGYRDGCLPWEDAAAIEGDVEDAIARTAATLVVTFDEDGLYWHPDHVATHQRVTAAVRALGDRAPALYYVTMPPGAMTRVGERVLGIQAAAFGDSAPRATHRLDCRAVAARKLAALRCHRSQVDGDPLDRLSAADAVLAFGEERYRRAAVGRSGETLLDKLALPL